MFQNKEAQLKERFAKAFEAMAREMKRSNDLALAKADHQHKQQAALFSLIEPALQKLLPAEDTTPGKEPRRGKKRGKVIHLRSPR